MGGSRRICRSGCRPLAGTDVHSCRCPAQALAFGKAQLGLGFGFCPPWFHGFRLSGVCGSPSNQRRVFHSRSGEPSGFRGIRSCPHRPLLHRLFPCCHEAPGTGTGLGPYGSIQSPEKIDRISAEGEDGREDPGCENKVPGGWKVTGERVRHYGRM